MRILITGACGFAGSTIAEELANLSPAGELFGLDNLSRPGSEVNRSRLKKRGVRLFAGDVRNASDLESLPTVDWVVDAAANPSVLAGVTRQASSRQLIENNLLGTFNVLEYCKRSAGGLVLLSTSRVYSIAALASAPLDAVNEAFVPRYRELHLPGWTERAINEHFSTHPPLSLYGCSKLASELLALEYGAAFGLPVYINRCGVLAGAGQFGKPDQGIFSFWINSYCWKRPLKYIGFGGRGHQVRDCLHPRDLAPLLHRQMQSSGKHAGQVINLSGGAASSISLAQLSQWCLRRFGPHSVGSDENDRPFDVPWIVLDPSHAEQLWQWRAATPLEQILDEIATHALAHPEWLELSNHT
jgi:CDP-paratose 2-epimerase